MGGQAMRVPLLKYALTIVALAIFPALGIAEDTVRVGDIRVEVVWARASIGTSRPGAAYLTIVNEGSDPDRLLRIETPVAARAEVHETVSEEGVMKMRPVGEVEIPARTTIKLKPGGLHIMLMGLSEPLDKGGKISLTLRFEKSGAVSVDARIAGPGASKPPN